MKLLLRKSFRFTLQWAFFSLVWSGVLIMIAVMTSQPKSLVKRRYGYAGSTDLMPNYDPFVEDLNRKIDDLTEELLSIRQLLKRLNLSPHSKIIRKIDLKIKRLLLNFDVKEEAISSDKNNVIDLESTPKLIHVCPEQYQGTLSGYPLYKSGFVTVENCDQEKTKFDASKIVTIVYNFVNVEHILSEDQVTQIIDQTISIYPGIKIKVATGYKITHKFIGSSSNVEFIPIYGHDGLIWNKLLENVKTPYVFLGLDLKQFDESINFERMIRVLEIHNVDFVSGSRRTPEGKWHMNCFQSQYKNYSLHILSGYDRSTHDSCLICDIILGPFLTKTSIVQTLKFELKFSGSPLTSIDFFLKAKYAFKGLLLNCPDIMFNVIEDPLIFKDDFKSLAKKFNVYAVNLWSDYNFIYNTTDIQRKCEKTIGLILSPACIEELYNLLDSVFSICDSIKAKCQLQEGSLLGAVKLSNILPWERDADVAVLSSDFENLVHYLKGNTEGKLKLLSLPYLNGTVMTGGSAIINTNSWAVELNGQHELYESDLETKVQVGRLWLPSSYNPGLHVRNRYGSSVYKHVEHWLSLGKRNGWLEYGSSTHFTPCPRPDHHACLDRFETDGNIQFQP